MPVREPERISERVSFDQKRSADVPAPVTLSPSPSISSPKPIRVA